MNYVSKSLDQMIKEEVAKWDAYKNQRISDEIFKAFTKSQSSRKRKQAKNVNKVSPKRKEK